MPSSPPSLSTSTQQRNWQDWQTKLRNHTTSLQLDLADNILEKFAIYAQLLIKWNKTYNLTSISSPADILTHHFLDSLAIAPYIGGGHRVLDVGSGAGLPGIPLALVFPTCKFVLLDSNSKKVNFLSHVVLQLALTNVEVVQERVERFHFPQCFDTIVTRATSTVTEIIQQTLQLICDSSDDDGDSHTNNLNSANKISGGQWLFMKGKYPTAELQALKKWPEQQKQQKSLIDTAKNAMQHFQCTVHRLIIPELDAERHLVCVKKIVNYE